MKTEQDATDMKNTMHGYGLEEGIDYYIDKLFSVTKHFEAKITLICTETDLEDDKIDWYDKSQSEMGFEDEMHEERDFIGFVLLDTNYVSINLEELIKDRKPVGLLTELFRPNTCTLCGKSVIRSRRLDDKRAQNNDGELRCFSCSGVERDDDITE